ncbi:MAG: chromosomal replication initiator protein DnaA [Desulfobacterales bacterium]|nr:chromosomal replication initiator protein DnaA [Desulfobacterales bacterium]
MEPVWKEVKAVLQPRIPSHSFRMWIEPLEPIRFENGHIVLSAPNFFSRKRVLDHYGDMIEAALSHVSGHPGRLTVELAAGNGTAMASPKSDLQLQLPKITVQPHTGRLFRNDFTFDHFVVGDNNDFAYSASLALASRKNGSQPALYLLSKTGMGKSHLSQAIGHHILKEFPREKVYYITAEDFTSEVVHAFRHDAVEEFKSKYRNGCDVLLLEDVHYLSGKERTQVELALTLDFLLEMKKKIIFSSCYLPSEIPKLNDKLRSRLTSGLISNIEPPNFRTRVRILRKKASTNGCDVPEDVLRYLAGELTEDVRQLESGLIGVAAKSSLLGRCMDFELAESVVRNIIRVRKTITVEAIKRMVCREYRVSIEEIVSKSRKHHLVRPRQIAIYLSRRYTDAPLQMIGKSFNRYHATVLHSVNAVEKDIHCNAVTRRELDLLRKKLETGKF